MDTRQLLKLAILTPIRFVLYYALSAIVVAALQREETQSIVDAILNKDHIPAAALGAIGLSLFALAGDLIAPARKYIQFALRLAFIAAIFIFVTGTGLITTEKVQKVFSELDAGQAAFWLAFASIVKLGGIFSGIVRWQLLLRGQGIRFPLWYATKVWFTGRAIGLFLPGTVGLDGYKLVESAAYTGEVIKCTTVLAIDKLVGFLALAVMVFLTVPLGMRLYDFNPIMLAAVLSILGVFISVSFLLLLNPRIVQVLVAVLPVPGVIRNPVNKLGAAITAYRGQFRTLLLAVVLGLTGHLAICLMFFGTAMAMSGGEVAMLDVLFVSPLVIVGSIIAPTISGFGVREAGFGLLLGREIGETEAILAGHLGYWTGEMVPFVLSIPLLLFATRPNRDKFLADFEAVRKQGVIAEGAHLTHEQVRDYRLKLIGVVLAGLFGGLLGGALVGLGEARWIAISLEGLTEFQAYAWGPIVYSGIFAAAGLGVAAVLLFFYLMFDRFAPAAATYAVSAGGALAAGVLIIGKFRYTRDILDSHAMSMNQNVTLLAAAAGIGFSLALALAGLAWLVRRRPAGAAAAAFALYLLSIAAGIALARTQQPVREGSAFISMGENKGTNVILIAVDTLRADYLPMFSTAAPAATPNLAKFASDAAVLQQTFAQSSWTKPSFATIFSGLYPSAHTATTKTSALPDSIVTFPEALADAGYYTKGFANNPNIAGTFNFDQGFVDYMDLKPNLLFGARVSSSKLSMYEVLRHAWSRVKAKLTGGKINVTDFYQPAESVTNHALEWMDGGGRPSNAPFFLFLHYMDPHDPFMDWSHPGVGYARVQMGNPDPEKYLDKMKDAYRQEIEYMDGHLGRLFEGLRERNLYNDTLIVFTADHGEEFYDHKGWWHGQTLYDELIHIPLLMKFPRNKPVPALRGGLARHIDIAPTILTVAGATIPEAMQGQPLFGGGQPATAVYSEVDFEGNDLQSVRTSTHKLIHAAPDSTREFDPVELYDLAADPREQTNLAGTGVPSEATLEKAFDDFESVVRENAAEPSASSEIETETQEQLESLGYLE